MRFVITALATEDVCDSLRHLANDFAEFLRPEISGLVLSSGAEAVLFSPIVMPATMGIVADEAVFVPRQSAIKISQNIDHREWLESDKVKRVALYANALVRGLVSTPSTAISPTEIESLSASVDKVRHVLVNRIES